MQRGRQHDDLAGEGAGVVFVEVARLDVRINLHEAPADVFGRRNLMEQTCELRLFHAAYLSPPKARRNFRFLVRALLDWWWSFTAIGEC